VRSCWRRAQSAWARFARAETPAASSFGARERVGRHGQVQHQKLKVGARAERVKVSVRRHVGQPGGIAELEGLAHRSTPTIQLVASGFRGAVRGAAALFEARKGFRTRT